MPIVLEIRIRACLHGALCQLYIHPHVGDVRLSHDGAFLRVDAYCSLLLVDLLPISTDFLSINLSSRQSLCSESLQYEDSTMAIKYLYSRVGLALGKNPSSP